MTFSAAQQKKLLDEDRSRRLRSRKRGGGRGIFAPSILLSAGARLAVLGDSGFARGDVFSSTLGEHKGAGMHHWATARAKQRCRSVTWYDASATAANLIPAYGDASATDPLNHGANLGYSGETATGCKKRVVAWVNTGAEILLFRAGSNVGSTDATAAVTIAAIQYCIQTARTLAGSARAILLETILPRKVSLTPVGFELSPAEMARIITINDGIRANWSAWGANALIDCWEVVRDTQYNPGDQLYGTGLPINFITDGAHPSIIGAYKVGGEYRTAIDAVTAAGSWFSQASGGLFTNWNLTGSVAVASNSCSGNMPTAVTIQNTAGAGQPVTAVCALSSNAETGGQIVTITISSTGAGAANNYQELRIASTGVTTGFTSTDWFQFIPEFEVDGGGPLGIVQISTGEGSTVSARGLGQMGLTQGGAANEYWPADVNIALEPDTAPLQVGVRTSLVSRIHVMVRTDIAGSCVLRLKRWRMPIVPDPSITMPWQPV